MLKFVTCAHIVCLFVKIKSILEKVRSRYGDLQNGTNDRLATLEQVVRLSKEFRDKYDPVLAWLDGAERQVSQLDSASTDPKRIQRQIEDHKVTARRTCAHEHLHTCTQSVFILF